MTEPEPKPPEPWPLREAMEKVWQRPGVTNWRGPARWVDGDGWWKRQPNRTVGGWVLPLEKDQNR